MSHVDRTSPASEPCGSGGVDESPVKVLDVHLVRQLDLTHVGLAQHTPGAVAGAAERWQQDAKSKREIAITTSSSMSVNPRRADGVNL
ncbi:MAG: hypothetical protein R3B67_12215 [Phycisphaerales bacterium]